MTVQRDCFHITALPVVHGLGKQARRSLALLGCGAWALVAGAQSAAAQETQAGALSEIVVTAQHRQENVQTTPIALSVYGGNDLKAAGITDMQSLTAIAPDIGFTITQGKPIIAIRGISSRDTSEVGDPAVAVDIDGFYLNRPYTLDASWYDIARVEVLRGPQGTLNGRNSVGGAINVITAKPTDKLEGYASLEYGNYNALKVQGMLNVPISQSVQVRAAFLSSSHDGYRDNAPQKNGDDADAKSGRLEIAFQPAPQMSGWLSAQYSRQQGVGDVIQFIPYTYTSSGALNHSLPSGINANRWALATQPYLDLSDKQVLAHLDYDLGGAMITAQGGYDKTEWHHAVDQSNPDLTPSVFQFQENQYPETWNAELRAASKGTGPFQWQVGGFYFRETSHLWSADASPLASGGYDYYFGFVYRTRATSEALYGQASYQLADRTSLSVGMRYTWDQKFEAGSYGDLTGGIVYADQTGSSHSSKPTFHVALERKLTDINMIYAKVDTGYKTGGFNFGGSAYNPETVTAYEIGSKNRFFNDRLQVNVAAFYNDYSNQQVSTYALLASGESVQLTQNAGTSHIYGAEAAVDYRYDRRGKLNLTVNWLHARYADFLSAADPSDPSASGNVQLKGNVPPQSPTWSLSGSIDQDFDAFGGVLTASFRSKFQSASFFSFYNFADTRQKAYIMSDATLAYRPAHGPWKLSAFVHNLENSVVFKDAEQNQYAGAYAYSFMPPRTYGARIEVNF